jgi:hypothetical protein
LGNLNGVLSKQVIAVLGKVGGVARCPWLAEVSIATAVLGGSAVDINFAVRNRFIFDFS